MAESPLGGLLSGLTQGGALYSLLNDFKDQRDLNATTLGNITGDVRNTGTFQPWSVGSSVGNTAFNPTTGAMDFNPNAQQMGMQNQMFSQGQDLLGRAAQDPYAREQQIYDRMRAVQMPEEQRQMDSMNAGLFGTGRGGMTSANYGGSPEQMAFGKAQAEARNSAMLGAMGQAQNELTNQYTMGQGMVQSGYLPQNAMLAQAGLGNQVSGQYQNNQQGLAGMLAQLGIGGMTTDVNYANVMGNLYGEAAKAVGAAAGGGGDWLTSLGDPTKVFK